MTGRGKEMDVTQNLMDLAGIDRPMKTTLRDQIYTQLRSAIMAGRFLPGQHLGIIALAEALNVSAMPVREALRQLVAEGALEMLPNRMVKVPVMTHERFRQILGIRLLLECHATELAAPRFTPAQCDHLQQLSDGMTAALLENDVERYFALNQDFHFTIYAAASSDVLMQHIRMLWLKMGPFIRLSYSQTGVKATEVNHGEAIAALRAHDATAAANAIRMDLMEAADVIQEVNPAAFTETETTDMSLADL